MACRSKCRRSRLEIPVGSAPSDLAEHPETIGASVLNDAGWIAESDKLGKVTARPKPEQGPLAAGATLVLLVDGVQVNREVGTAVITICEDAAGSPSTAVRISKIRPPAPRAAATQRPRGT